MDRNGFNQPQRRLYAVALRKESVDRNASAGFSTDKRTVALRKESVDRNFVQRSHISHPFGRSPQGERG